MTTRRCEQENIPLSAANPMTYTCLEKTELPGLHLAAVKEATR
jgi:hypothetical protein